MSKTPLVAVVGPTASGKTAFAVKIAQQFQGEVISMDSMQIYRGMQIGTAAPTEEEMQGIPHHMLNMVDIRENFSVNDYVTLAKPLIEEIVSRGKLPILCGGTGLYFNSLIYGYNMTKAETDPAIKEELYAYVQQYGIQALFERLKQCDPVSAEQIHPNNVKRVVRALEVYEMTGVPKSQQTEAQGTPVYRLAAFGMDWPRETLYQRIDCRVEQMLSDGLEQEVRNLVSAGKLELQDDQCQAAAAIGYREMLDYLAGKTSYEETVALIKQNTRRYAKRQLTWFRKIKDITWLNPLDGSAEKAALQKIKQTLEI